MTSSSAEQQHQQHHTQPSESQPSAEGTHKRFRQRRSAALIGVAFGLVLFTLGQGVVLDRSGEDYAQAMNGLGLLMLVAVVISLFVQAALQDFRQHSDSTKKGNEQDANAQPRHERRDAYWFTAGLALAGVLLLCVTLTGTRIMPQMLPAAPTPPVQYGVDDADNEDADDDNGEADVPRRPFDRSPRPPEEHPFYRGD